MQRIIRVIYNPAVNSDGIMIQRHRDYVTNAETLEDAIQQVKVEIQKLIDIIGGEIISIEEFNTIQI